MCLWWSRRVPPPGPARRLNCFNVTCIFIHYIAGNVKPYYNNTPLVKKSTKGVFYLIVYPSAPTSVVADTASEGILAPISLLASNCIAYVVLAVRPVSVTGGGVIASIKLTPAMAA